MSAHTPGPWAADLRWDCAVPHFRVVALTGREYPLIATTNAGNSCEEGNATLIAAAPDMLEALQGLMDPATYEDGEWYREARTKARAAIAKATGGQS